MFCRNNPISLLGGPRPCKRYKTIKVQYQTLQMKTHVKNYIGWTAQIIQHEVFFTNVKLCGKIKNMKVKI